jgi:PPOX class probable F420-dependent enzyme
MRLGGARCEHLIRTSERGVLATVHPVRGVDAVPVCFVIDADRVAVPVDRIKPKTGGTLQRVRNLEHDQRAALLCDRWDGDDWSQLWWVRASLELTEGDQEHQVRTELEAALRQKYHHYVDQSFTKLLVFRITRLTGWSASASATEPA